MAFHTYLNRLRGWARPAPKAARPRKAKSRLGLENLEDRLALSTLSISHHVLTYQAAPGEVNDLTISRSGTTFTFTENSGVAIQVGSSLSSSATADSSLFDRIDVKLADKDDKVAILSTNKRIDVFGEDGNDTITVGATGRGMEDILATVNANGGAQGAGGKDQLILADRDAPAVTSPITVGGLNCLLPTTLQYTVSSTSVGRQRLNFLGTPIGTAVPVNYSNMEGVVLNASNQDDAISVASTLAATPVEVNAGGGADKITLGNLDLIKSKLTVRGEAGSDTLTVDDHTATAKRNYVINTDSLKLNQGTSTVDVASLDSLEGLTIKAPNQANAQAVTFDVQSMSGSMPLTLVGGSLVDVVTISDSALFENSTYLLDAGKVVRSFINPLTQIQAITGTLNYSVIDQIIVKAGTGNDTFKMTNTAQPLLRLDGGAGVADGIDYSAFTSSVTVNMRLGNATKVQVLSNVENAIGGSAGDILVGDANANTLKGLGGRDVIIGGKGEDQIFGGADEDLMIASDTDFDANVSALITIRNVWTGAGTIQNRVNQLKIGVVGPGVAIKLNDTTVHVTGAADDAARDVLRGEDDALLATPDWFWANPGNLSTQDDAPLQNGDIFK